jgi:hypothetical protein
MASIISSGTTSGTALNMTADTSGQLQLATGASATTALTIDTSQNLQLTNASASLLNSFGRKILNQSGSVLQVQSTTLSTSFTSGTQGSWLNITGLSVNITPSSTSSLILVRYVVAGALYRPSQNGVDLRCVRNSTAIGVGGASGSLNQIGSTSAIASTDSQQTACWEYLDSPASTSAQTYQVQVWQDTGGNPFYINRATTTSNPASGASVSTITVMEIAA